MDILLFLLGVTVIYLFVYTFTSSPTECPRERIIYKTLTEKEIDRQFSEENFPSKVHADLFDTSTPGFGGFTIGMGKTKSQV